MNKLDYWIRKYEHARAEYEGSRCNTTNVEKWRRAYLGDFKQLDAFGNETDKKMKPLRKMCYELVEQKVNPRIPAPKMSPRYHSDLFPVEATESLIKHEMDRMLSEETHDESEHATLIDGLSWFKVSWDPFDNTHERSGMPIVEVCPVDTVFPQPNVYNYKDLEYIFERKKLTVKTILDIYGKNIQPDETDGDTVNVIECYYLNEDRFLCKFSWADTQRIELCDEEEWAMRRVRKCIECGAVVNIEDTCPICDSTNIKYVSVKEQVLEEDMVYIENPYRAGIDNDEENDSNEVKSDKTIKAGTTIPYYMIRQLPFIPKRTVKLPRDIQGISEVALHYEPQDLVNKFLNKAERKSAASKTVITKPRDAFINDEGSDMMYVEVDSAKEANLIQVKQLTGDINGEITMSQMLYELSRSTTGVTDTAQGKADTTSRSAKSKQIQLAASESRQASSNKQRNNAYSGVYELIFKYLLAFSDEPRSFVKLLPDGSTREEVWSKYMFLEQDENGDFYYRDDFAWSVDAATEITQDRATMWQMIDNDYLNGLMGSQIDPIKSLQLYWHMKEQYGYPTAKFALSFLQDSIQHLPSQIEQALVKNPQAVDVALDFIRAQQEGMGLGGNKPSTGGQQGGQRNGSGRQSSGESKSQQDAKKNNTSRSNKGQTSNSTSVKTGGAQGGDRK